MSRLSIKSVKLHYDPVGYDGILNIGWDLECNSFIRYPKVVRTYEVAKRLGLDKDALELSKAGIPLYLPSSRVTPLSEDESGELFTDNPRLLVYKNKVGELDYIIMHQRIGTKRVVNITTNEYRKYADKEYMYSFRVTHMDNLYELAIQYIDGTTHAFVGRATDITDAYSIKLENLDGHEENTLNWTMPFISDRPFKVIHRRGIKVSKGYLDGWLINKMISDDDVVLKADLNYCGYYNKDLYLTYGPTIKLTRGNNTESAEWSNNAIHEYLDDLAIIHYANPTDKSIQIDLSDLRWYNKSVLDSIKIDEDEIRAGSIANMIMHVRDRGLGSYDLRIARTDKVVRFSSLDDLIDQLKLYYAGYLVGDTTDYGYRSNTLVDDYSSNTAESDFSKLVELVIPIEYQMRLEYLMDQLISADLPDIEEVKLIMDQAAQYSKYLMIAEMTSIIISGNSIKLGVLLETIPINSRKIVINLIINYKYGSNK